MSIFKRLLAAATGIAFVLALTYGTLRTPAKHPGFAPAMDVVLAFDKLAFDDRKPKAAVLKFLSADFVDHDPALVGTRDSVIARLDKLDWSTGGPKREVQRVIGSGDIVAIHHRLTRKPGDQPIAAIDMFRVKEGLIVEHWDVMQTVPEASINPAPMF
jgi:predicted SnoaL-like aldol condensation-catalyzing enzyme